MIFNSEISPQASIPLHEGAGHVRRQWRPPWPLRCDELPGDDDASDDDHDGDFDSDNDDDNQLPGDGELEHGVCQHWVLA